jgi:type IV pilus assembly protein PilW
MSVLYAVDTSSPSDGIADTYMSAALVTSGGYWNNVKAVRITLNFINPNATVTGQSTTIPWTQTINLMNNR